MRAVLVFVVVLAMASALIHFAVWRRLVLPAGPTPRLRSSLRFAWFSIALALPWAILAVRLLPRPLGSPLAWVAYSWLGLLFFLLLATAAAEVLRAGAWAVDTLSGPKAIDRGRREVLRRSLSIVSAGAAATTGAFAILSAQEPVRIDRVFVPMRKLPRRLDGLRIAQLSDVHIGPTLGRAFLEEVVASTLALKPDLIALTGDFVDGSVAELRSQVAPLRDLHAPFGTFFVTGNHEYYSGAEDWLRHFSQTLGARILRNERVRIGDADDAFDLVGIDDWSAARFLRSHGPKLSQALAGRNLARAAVLLAHQPKAIVQASALGVDLQLSGHTHGGQIKPFDRLVRLEQPYVAGLHRHSKGTQIYVNRGTGYWGPPMRLGVPAEISLLTLRSTQA